MKLSFKNLLFIVLIVFCSSGCKKVLEVEDLSALSGDDFWKTTSDADRFIVGIYNQFRTAISRDMSQQSNTGIPYLVFTGDMRGAPIEIPSSSKKLSYISYLKENRLNEFLRTKDDPDTKDFSASPSLLSEWDAFYRVISSANIVIEQIDLMSDPSFTDGIKKKYKAEAIFLRCLSYFFLVRQFGDLPYIEKAFFIEKIGRTDMIIVLENCSKVLESVKDDLPWTYVDPALVAVRAMKGSVLGLLMHINSWLASFGGDAGFYNSNVIKYAKELESNFGNYQLLPFENIDNLYTGNSKESLFEVPQNVNTREYFGETTCFFYSYYNSLVYDPINPRLKFARTYIKELYPDVLDDSRKEKWFKKSSIYKNEEEFVVFKKFLFGKADFVGAFTEVKYTGNMIIFRYADAILLYAEALAGLGEYEKAIQQINRIRTRANTSAISFSTGENVKYEIFYERCRELMGEGHYWYDAVRMGVITDLNVNFGFKTTKTNFRNRCWTWPLSSKVKGDNEKIVLNEYWL